MALEITPEPSEDERAAIAAALDGEGDPPPSSWADAVLPGREVSEEP
jgi:hypothetical protein